MKCEIKYVIHKKIKTYKSITFKELLVLIPIAALVVLFGRWLIGIDYTLLIIIGVYSLTTCLLLTDAIKYCKSKKE